MSGRVKLSDVLAGHRLASLVFAVGEAAAELYIDQPTARAALRAEKNATEGNNDAIVIFIASCLQTDHGDRPVTEDQIYNLPLDVFTELSEAVNQFLSAPQDEKKAEAKGS